MSLAVSASVVVASSITATAATAAANAAAASAAAAAATVTTTTTAATDGGRGHGCHGRNWRGHGVGCNHRDRGGDRGSPAFSTAPSGGGGTPNSTSSADTSAFLMVGQYQFYDVCAKQSGTYPDAPRIWTWIQFGQSLQRRFLTVPLPLTGMRHQVQGWPAE